ncbi:hypothetical protein ACI0X9_003394 [Cronobacter turicensis]
MAIPTTVLQVTKNVRLPAELLHRVDREVFRTGRTRNAEIMALLEEAIIQIKFSKEYTLVDLASKSEGVSDSLSGGESFQIRLSVKLVDIIVNEFPATLGQECVVFLSNETFSEKIRFLLIKGLSERATTIEVELGSLDGFVFHDKCIDYKFTQMGEKYSRHFDTLIKSASCFEEHLHHNAGHVFLTGEPGSGKTFLVGYYRHSNPRLRHYLNLGDESYRNILSRKIIILWSNSSKYTDKQTLIIDEASNLDSDYLMLFLKKAEIKNVRVILVSQNSSVFNSSIQELIDIRLRITTSHKVYQDA